jgi:hypothetical protein
MEKAEETSPEDKLKLLLQSELFKINNFTRIFEILHPIPAALDAKTPEAPAAPTAAPTAAPADIKLEKNGFNLIIKGGKYQKSDIIDNYFSNIEIFNYSNIKDSIKNENILSNLSINTQSNIITDIIVDPAGIKYVYNDWNRAGGLSGYLYDKIDLSRDPNSTLTSTITGSMIPELAEITRSDLFTTKEDAFYKEYFLKNNNTDTVLSNIPKDTDTKINIIHSIGPVLDSNYSSDSKIDIEYLNYNTYNKIYNDIYKTFKKEKKEKDTLRLSALSTGLFAGNYKNEILYITALVYIKLYNTYLTDNINNKIFMYIVETSTTSTKEIFDKNTTQETYEKFIEIINEINKFHI